MTVAEKNKVSISKGEYLRLKKLENRFGDLLSYIESLVDIREAREEIKKKKIISQEDLLKRLGL